MIAVPINSFSKRRRPLACVCLFSCSKGVCGTTCKSKKVDGQVVMTHGGGIRQREIDAGMILICCSKPLSDVTIEK
ncbi:hypothetical protein ACFXS9_00225 [Bradyrhizobium sp. RDI18]